MNARQLGIPTHASARAPDLARCSHGLDIGDTCAKCTAEGLETVERFIAAAQRYKGCDHPIGCCVDYCGVCTSEDDTDCW